MSDGKLERIKLCLDVLNLAKTTDPTDAETERVVEVVLAWLDTELGVEKKVVEH